MDRVLRAYSHTAWTPADPLQGLDDEVRRAILLMPSTFRERWKLAPWTDRQQRRMAVADIIAERRLLYELSQQRLSKPQPNAAPAQPAGLPTSGHKLPVSPYYQYRLAQHRQAMEVIRTERVDQDVFDLANIPAARAERVRLDARRRALLLLDVERAKLDMKEMQILAGDHTFDAHAAPLSSRKPSQTKRQRPEKYR